LVSTGADSEWDPQVDQDGNTYYYNVITGETKWSLLDEEWQEADDGNGNIYYYNAVSGETSWDLPEVNLLFYLFFSNWHGKKKLTLKQAYLTL